MCVLGGFKGDTRSLDYTSCNVPNAAMGNLNPQPRIPNCPGIQPYTSKPPNRGVEKGRVVKTN